jgi:hypothetical protein
MQRRPDRYHCFEKEGLGCTRHKEEDIEILKGPKHEIFEHGIFTQIKPAGVGDLGTKQKNSKLLCLGTNFYLRIFFFGVG